MGKDSLIKSTAKKAESAKKKENPQKKTKKSATKSPTIKEAKKQTKKAQAAKPSKPAKDATPAAKAPGATMKPTPKPTLQELLFKKFDGQKPPVSKKPAAPDFSNMTAPPLISTDDANEAQRLRELLSRRFDMAEIKASAKPPTESEPDIKGPAAIEKTAQEIAPEPLPQAVETPAPEVKTGVDALSTQAEPETPATVPSEDNAAPPQEAKAEPPAPESIEQKEAPAASPTATSPAPQAAATVAPQPADVKPQLAKEPVDPVMRAAKIGAILAVAVFLMIIWTSYNNSGKYIIIPQRGAVEIWKGDFSPTGKSLFTVLHGYQLAEPVQETYSRKDVFPIVFGYYLNKADALLEVSGLPDYKAISDYLAQAEKFALSNEMRDEIQIRTTNIQRMTLYYKAEVDASKGTVESLESSLDNLAKIQRLTADPVQLDAVNQKIASVTATLEAAKTKQAEEAAAQNLEAAPETAPKP